ncbi:MAG: hypothetical protein L6R37_005431 [Teloschistes peruensis]|nr:MAG: hypothetical protein L6R37_005431 [Teloschistes peruensis]
MYFNALIFTGLVAALVNSEPACGPLSFVTVTVNAPPVTKTLAPPLNPFPPAPDGSTVPAQTAAIPGASSEATTTLSSTSILTDTNFVTTSNVQDLGLPQDGSFSFAVVDSTTTWLGGKTPDSSVELVTNTLVVTIVPQPVTTPSIEHALAADGDTTTSYKTISSTSYYTHHLTAGPLPAPTSLSSPTPNFLPYLRHKGWNTTLTTLQKLRSGAAPSNAWPTYTAIWATSVKWIPTTSLDPKPKQARQVGAIVTATINGVVVSWTNSYAGEQTTPVLPVSVGGVVTSVLPASVKLCDLQRNRRADRNSKSVGGFVDVGTDRGYDFSSIVLVVFLQHSDCYLGSSQPIVYAVTSCPHHARNAIDAGQHQLEFLYDPTYEGNPAHTTVFERYPNHPRSFCSNDFMRRRHRSLHN